jgi:ubiquinone/menaquinone biosynthesis C-methylase UbiE
MIEGQNFSLAEEIRDYWSQRAETFDSSVGHGIFDDRERLAWHRLLRKHLGAGEGRTALDLACGTGVVSLLLHEMGYQVTGLDWAEPMLEKARGKARARGAEIKFLLRDAEATLEAAESYDVIVNRHLVWTLLNPEVAFAEWFRLLKPGGTLLIIDGDYVGKSWFARLRQRWQALWPQRPPSDAHAALVTKYASIQQRLYFANGLRSTTLVRLLQEAGFADPVIDTNLLAIDLAQARHRSWAATIEQICQHRYAVAVTKPAQ